MGGHGPDLFPERAGKTTAQIQANLPMETPKRVAFLKDGKVAVTLGATEILSNVVGWAENTAGVKYDVVIVAVGQRGDPDEVLYERIGSEVRVDHRIAER